MTSLVRWTTVALAALTLLGAAPLNDQPVVRGGLGHELDRYLSRLEGFGFSGAVLVEKDGQIALSKGYGWADIERRRPVTTGTAFHSASVTKQFTAAAIVLLAERGRLSMADSLGRFFPTIPADKRAVTVGQLLSHASGIRGPEEANGAVVGDISRDAWLARAFATPLAFPPGTDNEYSNSGFSVAAAIVEVVSGQRWEDFVREELFVPAGMRATGFSGDFPRGVPVAHGYGDYGGGDPSAVPLTWGDRGAGGVMTTIGDLYKWEIALRAGRPLSRESQEQLFTVHSRTGQFFDYGYAWRIQRTRWGTRMWWASGYDRWGNAMMWRMPDDRATVVFMSNIAWDSFPLRDALAVPGYRGAIEPILSGRDYTLPPWSLDRLRTRPSPWPAATAFRPVARSRSAWKDRRCACSPSNRTRRPRSCRCSTTPRGHASTRSRGTPASSSRRSGTTVCADCGHWRNESPRRASGSIRRSSRSRESCDAGWADLRGGRHRVARDLAGADRRHNLRAAASGGEGAAAAILLARGQPERCAARIPLSVLPPFRAQSSREFVSYHIALRKPLRVRFETTPIAAPR
jgi:CubicO group peptidase (beta-lactamase class C family)